MAAPAPAPDPVRPAVPDHELLRRIGVGAYGEVWLARTVLGELRAVKIIRRDAFGDDPRPFEREFEGIRRFEPISRSDPSQIAILHVGRAPDDSHFYYVMELGDPVASDQCSVISNQSKAPGPAAEVISNQSSVNNDPQRAPVTDTVHNAKLIADSLTTDLLITDYSPRTLRSDLQPGTRLPVAHVVELGLALTQALGHLHRQGLVHRDVKPSNIIFVGGRPKLADIGLVTQAAAGDDARSIVGTEGYLAAEGPGTAQADLYALGKVLYEAAMGRDRRDFPDLPLGWPDVPEREALLELNEVIVKACAADRRERYQSADRMHADLELLRAGRSVRRRQAWQQGAKLARRFALPFAALALLVMTGWLALSRFKPSTVQSPNSAQPATTLAVLPFDEEDAAAGDDLGARLTEEIRSGLARVPGLGVIGRASSEALKKSGQALTTARSNKVSAVLEGRLRRQGDQVRLSLELNDTASGRMLWTESLESPVADPFALQIAVVERVPAALGIPLTETQRLRLVTRPTGNLEAYRAYLEGRHAHWVRADFKAAVEQLRTAVELDPGFALAWAELANAYGGIAEAPNQSAKEPLQLAKAAGQKALELAPNLAEVQVALASIKETEYDWPGAEAAYRRALEIDPNHLRADHWYGFFLQRHGRFVEARPHRERALALDPFFPGNIAHLANQLVSEGRLAEALEKYRESGKQVPHWSVPFSIGEVARTLGRDAEALDTYEEHYSLLGESREALSELRAAHTSGGWPAYWRTRLNQIERPTSPHVQWHIKARFHALTGNADEAFACMARSIEDHEFGAMNLKADEAFKPYRSDPRFKELLRKMNLEP